MARLGWFVAGFGVAAAAAARFLRRPAAPVPTVPPAAPPVPPPAPVSEEPAPSAQKAASPLEPEAEVDDPEVQAEALRRRIAESRSLVEERDEFEDGETPVDQADPDARRRAVHERGRDAVDRMRDPG